MKVVIGISIALVLGTSWGLDERSWTNGLCVGILIAQSLMLYEWFCNRWSRPRWMYKARKVGSPEPCIHCTSDNWASINKWRRAHMAQYPDLIFTPITRIRHDLS